MLVLTTCPSAAAADRLAAALVGDRLAACVSRIDNVLSTYRWQDAVHSDQEVLLLIKTTEARLADVESAIRAQSDYELPECIAVRIDAGSSAYLNWLAAAAAG
jgi:periplasmic divalent cation tolerance protein